MMLQVKRFCLLLAVVTFILVGQALVCEAAPWKSQLLLPGLDSGVKIGLPKSIAIDAQKQRYYVVDAAKGQLVSFDKEGKFLAAFNAGGELQAPVSLARAAGGQLWVVNRASNELLYINPRQKEVKRLQLSYPDGSLIFPRKVALSATGNLFLLDKSRGEILQLDDDLQVVKRYAGKDGGRGFVDFKLKPDGIWALAGLDAAVYHFARGKEFAEPVVLNGMEFPVSLEVDTAGQLYVLDRHAGKVLVFSESGEHLFSFLEKGKRAGQLWYAAELMFDWQERLCVADEGNGRVEVLSR